MVKEIYCPLVNQYVKGLCSGNTGKDAHEFDFELGLEEEYEQDNIKNQCVKKCDEMCDNMLQRLQKIKDIVHLRSSKPNVILIDTLTYVKQNLDEVKKNLDAINAILYREKKVYEIMEDIFQSLDNQHENVQKIYNICNENIVITKNNTELVIEKPEKHNSFSLSFVNDLLYKRKNQNNVKNETPNKMQNENNNTNNSSNGNNSNESSNENTVKNGIRNVIKHEQ